MSTKNPVQRFVDEFVKPNEREFFETSKRHLNSKRWNQAVDEAEEILFYSIIDAHRLPVEIYLRLGNKKRFSTEKTWYHLGTYHRKNGPKFEWEIYGGSIGMPESELPQKVTYRCPSINHIKG